MTIITYNVPLLNEEESPKTVFEDYIKAGAEGGSLWHWEGEVVPHDLVDSDVDDTGDSGDSY
jgi:hypothetical protein